MKDYFNGIIVPLITKEAEVEKLLGQPIDKIGYVKTYEMQIGKITVFYGGTKDVGTSTCKWKVSLDTVKAFTISLSKPIPISNIKFDLNSFEKEKDHLGEVTYTNMEKGVSFVAYEAGGNKELINRIYYFPTINDKKDKCG